ncbi:MAG: hypothetical protein GKS03_16500 [Alphaproteobacteria bacterium]|nr:hypothetical protein [Alphaproteobacteria bacterium]
MIATLRFVLLTALRDRLFAGLFALVAVGFALAIYLGDAALVEKGQTTVVYAGGAARTILVLGLIVFQAFHIQRLYETREIEAVLSRAISRERFIVAYWAGFALVGVLLAAPIVALVMLFQHSLAGAVWWASSLIFESFIVVAFAVFAGITLEKAVPAVFATVGFYVLGRLMSFFMAISGGAALDGVNVIAVPLSELVALLVPRLDLFAQTRWLVYGPGPVDSMVVLVAQTVLYVTLLLFAAMFDLRRKRF